jgi:hypothetical protein
MREVYAYSDKGYRLRRSKYDDATVFAVLDMAESGEALAAIARITGIPRRTVRQWVKRGGRESIAYYAVKDSKSRRPRRID